MNDNTALLELLVASEMYRTYVRAFSDATGLPLTLRGIESWQPPLHGKKKENAFCAMMASRSSSCAACLQMQEDLAIAARDGAAIVKCAFGLVEGAVPVKLGEDLLGYLVTGQVFLKSPTEGQFEKVERKLAVNMDSMEVRQAYEKTRVMSKHQFEAALRLLASFADHLATKSNEIVTHQSNHDPIQVTKAKTYIEQNLTEDITLADVAKAACTSTFYICKLFKKCTGLNLSEYISRLRIERTRKLLANPNLRISEIAFEVGFQSLTHFNRVFRKIVGQPPTLHRESLALPLVA